MTEYDDGSMERDTFQRIMAMDHLPRRKFLAGMGATAAAAFLAACGSSSSSTGTTAATTGGSDTKLAKGESLDIYTWPSYFSQTNLNKYKKLTGTTITQSTYESNDAMFAKLAASNGNSGFDMAIPTSGWIKVMADKGLVQKIDHDRIPFTNIDPKLLNKSFDPGNVYSVPKDYGYNGVIYDPAVITKPIKTWMDFIDAIKGEGSGKSSYGIDYETISTGLWALGYEMNDSNKKHLQASCDLMKSTAKHVKEFNSFDTTGMINGSISLMACDQSVARSILLKKPNFKFVVPLPHSELWVDNYTILTNAAHTDQAYSFVDFQLRPTSQVTDTEFIGYPTVLKGLSSKLPANYPEKNVSFIPPKVYETLQTYVVNEDLQGYIEDLASQVQAAAS